MPSYRSAAIFAHAAYLFSLLAQGVFAFFVLALGWNYLPLHPLFPMPWPWIVNIGWLVLFAVQHSGMARSRFKTWFARLCPAHLQRSMYVAISGLLVLGLALTWQPLPGEPFWDGPRWISTISVLGGIGMVACAFVFDHREFFGLKQATTGKTDFEQRLQIVGPYRFVRHPLMLALLIFLWGHAEMPTTLAFLNAGMTLYVLLALPLEERDLIRTFGPAYEDYRLRVPALIPYRWPIQRQS